MSATRCTCLGLPMGPGQTCHAHQATTVHTWCFSHGTMHHFTGSPWCTATWVAFAATTEADALAAKQEAYGDAQFLDDLPADQQVEIIEIAEKRQ